MSATADSLRGTVWCDQAQTAWGDLPDPTALAYTLSGRWAYDDGSYSEGDLVLESVGNNHLPWSDIGTEMLLVFESPNGQYLDNQLEDGTCFHLGMPFFSAVAEMSASEWETAEVLGLVEMIPEMRAA